MLISPLAGYFGDKHSRKLLIIAGVLVWISSLVLAYLIPEVSAQEQKSPTQTPLQESVSKITWNFCLRLFQSKNIKTRQVNSKS